MTGGAASDLTRAVMTAAAGSPGVQQMSVENYQTVRSGGIKEWFVPSNISSVSLPYEYLWLHLFDHITDHRL
jgi:hypothetical protein